jgi:light-regulated signal transduction histidine kinase (bacteriophytochrome)
MSALVGDLLSFADTGVPKPPVRVDLQTVLAQVKSNLLPAIQASGATVTAGCLPVIRSNEILMIRLFQNLIGNALAYRGQDPVGIHVDAAQRGSDWVIRIKDNGVGIEPENHARIFLPFKRLAGDKVPGSGLGLAICKKVVEGLGGTIWVESELGAGSTFCFTVAAPSEE